MSLDKVVEVRRRWGRLYTIVTSLEKRYLVLKGPGTARFLEEGAEISEEEAVYLGGEGAVVAALDLSYRLLSVRDRTVRELEKALANEGIVDREIVDVVIDRLRSNGYLDDRRLTDSFIEYMLAHKPSGPYLVRAKLRKLGVDEELIEEAIADHFSEEVERGLALKLALKKLSRISDRRKAARRVHDFLLRRGFSEYIVNNISANILAGKLD